MSKRSIVTASEARAEQSGAEVSGGEPQDCCWKVTIALLNQIYWVPSQREGGVMGAHKEGLGFQIWDCYSWNPSHTEDKRIFKHHNIIICALGFTMEVAKKPPWWKDIDKAIDPIFY